MDDDALSFPVRLAIARIARLVRKLDRVSTGLSREQEVVALLRLAAEHQHADVRSIYREMLDMMNMDELRYLADSGITLPADRCGGLPDARGKVASPDGRPRRVYRGRVIQD
ncbi:MAG: hypothetical protein JJT90_07765 [Ectothiorhodospiraceae bacterium]|nr:hypothetical protein [Ectothiorhodospiraceae bacterium]